jgi:hypothetical protein
MEKIVMLKSNDALLFFLSHTTRSIAPVGIAQRGFHRSQISGIGLVSAGYFLNSAMMLLYMNIKMLENV